MKFNLPIKHKPLISATLQLLLLALAVLGIGALIPGWRMGVAEIALFALFAFGGIFIMRNTVRRVQADGDANWKRTSAEFDVLTQKTQGLFNDMASEFNTQFSQVKSELMQVQALLNDAIGKLISSFTGIQNRVHQQQQLTLGLIDQQGAETAAQNENDINIDKFIHQTSDTLDMFVDATVTHSKVAMSLVGRMDDIVGDVSNILSVLGEIEGISRCAYHAHMRQTMKSIQSNQSRKRPVNLTLNAELISTVKGMTDNLSGVVEQLLTDFVMKQNSVRQEKARTAEVAAQAWNAFNERSGSFADEHSTL